MNTTTLILVPAIILGIQIFSYIMMINNRKKDVTIRDFLSNVTKLSPV